MSGSLLDTSILIGPAPSRGVSLPPSAAISVVSLGELHAGVPQERVLIDPGIGFGKTAEQNWVVMQRMQELRELGQPILIGTSRKSFIGKLLEAPVTDRIEGTAATVTAAVLRGADVVRVHDVREMSLVVRAADRRR